MEKMWIENSTIAQEEGWVKAWNRNAYTELLYIAERGEIYSLILRVYESPHKYLLAEGIVVEEIEEKARNFLFLNRSKMEK
jgi:hypothetical protein